jgi:hypothetical protein
VSSIKTKALLWIFWYFSPHSTTALLVQLDLILSALASVVDSVSASF